MPAEDSGYGARCARLGERMRAAAAQDAPVGLAKRTSNLFRDRAPTRKQRLDLGEFRHVLAVDPGRGWIEAEGLATFEDMVAAALPAGVMPAVVPQLKTITLGGAAAGVGIEATSFRQGLVHESLLEFDVLLASGEIVRCRPDNEHRELFYGFPNSYGTLGYALRLRQRTLPVRRHVRVEHLRADTPQEFLALLQQQCAAPADFVDAVAFGPRSFVVNAAAFTDDAPWLSDYRFERIYYRSLLERPLDYLRTEDYIWRWDTDWFWCSKNFGAQHPLVRRLLGPARLNSRTYQRWMRWNARWGLTRGLARLRGRHVESVIQDVDIPVERAGEFLEFLLQEVPILPIWVCPLRHDPAQPDFTLYRLAPGRLYLNFGFWDTVETREAREPGYLNRRIERETLRLGGIKSLYSESYFPREEFDRAYNRAAYEALKARYDPGGRLLGLYEKTVLRA